MAGPQFAIYSTQNSSLRSNSAKFIFDTGDIWKKIKHDGNRQMTYDVNYRPRLI